MLEGAATPDAAPVEAVLLVLALAGGGLPVLALLVRRRGTPRDPVPRGQTPVHAAGIAAAVVAILAGGAFRTALVGTEVAGEGAPPLPAVMLGVAAGHAVGILLGVALLRVLASPRPASPAPRVRAGVAGALSALAFQPVSFALALLVTAAAAAWDWQPVPQQMVLRFQRGGVEELVVVGAFAVIVAPLAEEWIFRGFLFRGLRALARPGIAAFVSAAVFSLMHLEPGNPVALPVTFLLGLVLADLAERTGGLTAPIAMHACYNGAQVLVMLMSRGATGPPGGG